MKITKKQLSRLIKEELEEKKNKSNKLHPSIKKIIRDDADWLIFTIKSDKDSVQYFGGRAGGSHPLPLNVSEDVKEIYLITDRSNGKKHAVVEYDDGDREYSDPQMKKTIEDLLGLKESKMKITKSNLKQIIHEVIKEIKERTSEVEASVNTVPERGADPLVSWYIGYTRDFNDTGDPEIQELAQMMVNMLGGKMDSYINSFIKFPKDLETLRNKIKNLNDEEFKKQAQSDLEARLKAVRNKVKQPIGESKMKITKSKLKQLIKEELENIVSEQEESSPRKQLDDALAALKGIGNFQTTYAVALYKALEDKGRLDVFEKLKTIPVGNQKERKKAIKEVFPGFNDAIIVRGTSYGNPEPAKIRPSKKRVLVTSAVINIPEDKFLSPEEMEAKSKEIDRAHEMFKPAFDAFMKQTLSAADARYGRRFPGDRGSLGS